MSTVAVYGAFIFSIGLLVTTTYFLLGGLPLLVLEHDVPLDARFVRSFFGVYYRAVFWIALGAVVSFAGWGRYAFALGTMLVAVLAVVLRHRLLPTMQRLGARIETSDATAIQDFRRIHAAALLINLVQLVALVWGLIRLSQQLSP